MKEVGLILKKLGESNGLEMALDENLRAAALRLYTQCHNILVLKQERSDSHDAYKLAARLAVLSQLIGKMPCWNCKSGKDRTGEMDVECKFLAALIARGEPIPAPGAKLTAVQRGFSAQSRFRAETSRSRSRTSAWRGSCPAAWRRSPSASEAGHTTRSTAEAPTMSQNDQEV